MLIDSRAYIAPYLLAAIFALYCLHCNASISIDRSGRAYRIITAAATVAGIFITLANYDIWLQPVSLDVRSAFFVRLCKTAYILIIFAGSFVSTQNILLHVILTEDRNFTVREHGCYKHFLIPFAVILCIYTIIWVGCYFPGLMSPDSIDQVRQLFTREYSNHQPYYHTRLLGIFIGAGTAISGNINGGVAFYAIFQIVVMAATFAFVVYNMAKTGFPDLACTVATIWYALMPFHIMYSFTVWKDVLFGAAFTLMIVFIIRMTGTGGRTADYIAFAVSSVTICLIRSNGLFAYVFVFAACLLLARSNRRLIGIMAGVIVASFLLKHSVLAMLDVTEPDTVESLSIPLQQIARVIADDGSMTKEDIDFLSEIIDIGAVKDNYNPDISDPIKNMIRDYGNQEYLGSHMGDFARVYVRTIVRNPLKAVLAWVDSTCGYWNSGYSYWVWYWDIEQNEFGISRCVNSPAMLHFMDEYLWLFYNNRILQLFTSIGLHVWIVLILFAKYIAKGSRAGIIACVAILAILLSLLVSSPVYSEFRYMYAMFCALPILAVPLSHRNMERTQHEDNLQQHLQG